MPAGPRKKLTRCVGGEGRIAQLPVHELALPVLVVSFLQIHTTALKTAAIHGHVDAVKLLLQAGADAMSRDNVSFEARLRQTSWCLRSYSSSIRPLPAIRHRHDPPPCGGCGGARRCDPRPARRCSIGPKCGCYGSSGGRVKARRQCYIFHVLSLYTGRLNCTSLCCYGWSHRRRRMSPL